MALFKREDPPVLTVHVGDLHVGSTVALCPPTVDLDDGGRYVASPEQRWYWDCWTAFWEDVAALKKKHDAKCVVVFGGDEREGDHHETTQVWAANEHDQDVAVIKTLEVAGAVGDEFVFVRGTMVHDGPASAATERYARYMAGKGWNVVRNGIQYSFWTYTAVHGGVKLQVRHQPQTRTGVRYLQDAAAERQARYTYREYVEDWIEPPDVAVWHHVHYRAKNWHRTVFCYFCPPWQLPTNWAHRYTSSPRVEPPGGVAFLCEGGKWTMFELEYKPKRKKVAWAE